MNSPFVLGFPGSSGGKEFACNAGDLDSVAGSRRSPGKGNGYPLRYSAFPGGISGNEPGCQCCRRGFNPWVGKAPLEEEMPTHSSILAGESRGQRNTAGYTVHRVAESQTRLKRLSTMQLNELSLLRGSVVSTLCGPMDCSTPALLSDTVFQRLLEFMSVESRMPSAHLTLCHPLLLPSTFPSIRIFSNESALCIRWPKY